MLGVNAKHLNKMLKAQKQISQQANRLSNRLIRELEVQNCIFQIKWTLILI